MRNEECGTFYALPIPISSAALRHLFKMIHYRAYAMVHFLSTPSMFRAQILRVLIFYVALFLPCLMAALQILQTITFLSPASCSNRIFTFFRLHTGHSPRPWEGKSNKLLPLWGFDILLLLLFGGRLFSLFPGLFL